MKKYLLLLLSAITLSAEPTFVETDRAKLFCTVEGKGSPIIVLHGGPGLSQDYLLPQMNKLAENHLVIFYDQRGSGKSEGGQNEALMQLSVFIEDIEAIRKNFGLEKVSILGHSWGGFLAMNYAIAYPEAIGKLILLNSMPSTSEDLELFLQEWTRRMTPHMDELNQIQNSKEFAAGDPDTMANYLQIIFRTYCALKESADVLQLQASPEANRKWIKTSEHFSQTLFAMPFNLDPDLKELSCKTLIVHSDRDPIPLSTAKHLSKVIPSSQLVVLKDCGHFPYVEKPEELFPILETFLNSSDRPQQREQPAESQN